MRRRSILKYSATRLLLSILVLFFVSVLLFVLIRLMPGDPIEARIGPYGDFSDENIKRISAELGLDKPYPVQYLVWIRSCLKGDFGVSLRNGVSVLPIVFSKFLISFELIAVSLLVAVLISVPLGILSGVRQDSHLDKFLDLFSVFFLAMPSFCVGLLLIVIFSVKTDILPANGYISFLEDPILHLRFLIMPTLTEALFLTANIVRFIRSETVEVASSNYVRTAIAKGLPEKAVCFRHILKNIAPIAVNISAIQLATAIGGTVIIEQLFGWAGLGWYIVYTIQVRDYPAVQCAVMLIALCTVVIHLLADILCAVIDPRIELK